MEKIKVAHIITRMIIGGAQENTLYTLEGLMADPSYEVTLVTGPTYGPEGSLMDQVVSKNVRTLTVPTLRRNINPLYDLCAFLHLLTILKRENFDIVHTHSSKAGILARLAAKCLGVKTIIHTIHGLPFHKYESAVRNALYKFLERIVASFTTKIITVCDEMARQAVDAKIASPEKFCTIFSGLDTQTFLEERKDEVDSLRKSWDVPDNAVLIGKIGRLFHLKGHKYLLPAAREVITHSPQTYFVFVGGGMLEEELKQQARDLGIEKHIIFVGLIPPDDIPLYIRVMDIVVHVSLREGLPRVVPQAFLSHKPVVAFDIDGARDIIEDGVNGFLVNAKNIEMLAKQLLVLINLPSLRSEFASAGYEKALTLFSKEKMVEDISALYQKCLSGPSPSQ
jgi:glycosyltransferase involved in cell wall biosynthesis